MNIIQYLDVQFVTMNAGNSMANQIQNELLFKQYFASKEFIEDFEERLADCFNTICPLDDNYHAFKYDPETKLFVGDVYLADCCDWEFVTLSREVVNLWFLGKKDEAIKLAKQTGFAHDKVENFKDNDMQWIVKYEYVESGRKTTGRKYVESKDEALAEFNRLYDAHEYIIIEIIDDKGNTFKSCTKGYE